MNTYETLLELEAGYDIAQLKAAFYKKAKQFHPDLNKAADAAVNFRKVKEAFDALEQQLLKPKPKSYMKRNFYRVVETWKDAQNIVLSSEACYGGMLYLIVNESIGFKEYHITIPQCEPHNTLEAQLNDGRFVRVRFNKD